MYTQCPHCQTCFRIAEAHLKAAKGKVRCGSCQDVFDATGHLYTKLPATAENRVPPVDDFLITPEDLKRVDHQHIDLSASPIEGSISIPTEPSRQSEQSDQSAFMESTVGDDTHYNNLDHMDPISLPGELDFGDSFINVAGDKPDKSDDVAKPNAYEDIEATEAPTSPEEADAIQDLYTVADELLHTEEAPDALTEKSDIDKHIEELASFANGLDMDTDLSKSDETEFDDPDDIEELRAFNAETNTTPSQVDSDVEDLISSLDDKPENLLATNKSEDIPSDHLASSIDFNPLDLAMEPLTSERPSVEEQALGVKDPEPHLAFSHDPEPKPAEPEPASKLDDFEQELQDIDLAFHPKPEADKIENEAEFNPEPVNAFDDFEKELEGTDLIFRPNSGADAVEEESEFKPESKIESNHNVAFEPDTGDLPEPPEEQIPLSLRRSLENMEIPARPLVQTIGLTLIILVLVVGLFTQFVLFRNIELVRTMPSLASAITSMCNSLPCRYSGPVDVSQISLMNRDVRSHPSQKNALLISAAFINQADFDQPYPDIQVTLSDLSGNIVANRRFTPQEYLDRMYNKYLLMESGTPVRITLPVLDPGDDAINFEFTFL